MKNKNFEDVSAAKFAGQQVDFLQKIRNGQIPYEVFNRILNISKDELVKRILGDQKSANNLSFKVSEVFGHGLFSTVRQIFSDNYLNYIWSPNQNKTLTVPLNMQKLEEYVLPSNMNDTKIQEITKSTPMDEETFLVVLYCLIIQPELGKELLGYELSKDKYCLLHVICSDGTIRTVRLVLRGIVWCFDVFEFDSSWLSGHVFLYFTAA